MKREELSQKRHKLLNCLSGLPRKILLLYGQENVTEFVLHELCQKYCFNLTKAAYFVDNPDFDCLKGVAGFCRKESYTDGDIWQNPKAFSMHMKSAPFNKKVRLVTEASFKKKGESEEEVITNVSHNLEIKKPGLYVWNIKYDNHGYFIYEKADDDSYVNEHLIDGLYLLSFCPLY